MERSRARAIRRSLVFATNILHPLIPLAQRAEAAGFSRAWVTEYNERDALVRSAVLGMSTTRIGVATGIAYTFTRQPLAAAAAAADIYLATGGRFTLGLGMGTRGMRERWYGMDTAHPASAFAEYVAIVKAAWRATGGLKFEGKHYSSSVPGFAFRERDKLEGLEVWGSGLNAAMLRTAAATCDGLALHPMALPGAYWEQVVKPAVDAGRARAERPPKIGAWLLTSVHEDEERARLQAKKNLVFYFSTPSYQSVAAAMPWTEAAKQVMEAFRADPSPERLAHLVPERMVDDLALAGTPAQVRARLPKIEAELAARGADEVVFQIAATAAREEDIIRNADAIIDSCRP